MVRCIAEGGGTNGFFLERGTAIDSTAKGNAATGFVFSLAGSARACLATGNASSDFNLGGGTAEECRAESNGSNGFTSVLVASGCVSVSNTGDGVSTSNGAVVRGCSIAGNTGDGVQVASGCRVEANDVSTNNQHGVNVTGSRSTIVNNSINSNGRATGVFAGVAVSGTDNSVDGNHITNMLVGGDDFGIQVPGTSNLIVRNQLSGVSTYLSIAGSNTSGGASTTPSTAGPWANITY